MLKILIGHSRSLRGYYEVTSGLIQTAPIELKFDMNNPEVNLNVLISLNICTEIGLF